LGKEALGMNLTSRVKLATGGEVPIFVFKSKCAHLVGWMLYLFLKKN
jgi:hypothetical protein